jgi:hypothetical protein
MKTKMKTGQIFWGVFFVTIGSLIFLTRYDVFDFSWSYVWEFWPVLLVLWGLSIIVNDTKIKPAITVLIALTFGGLVYGTVYNIVDDVDDTITWTDDDYEVRSHSEDFNSEISEAKLTLSAGVGSFTVKGSTSKLFKSTAKGNVSNYTVRSNDRGEKAFVNIEMEQANMLVFDGSLQNKMEVKLNKNPVWDLDLNLGAAKSYLDLSNYKVENVWLKMGAANTKIKLGDRHSNTELRVEMGAASLKVLIPKKAGCVLRGDMVLITKDLDGFEKLDSGNYRTENFNDAEQKIKIILRGAISSFEVIRY